MIPSVARAGIAWGALGVLAFSFTVPLTRVAAGGLSPLFIGAGRAVVAAILAMIVLRLTRQRWPERALWGRILVVAAGTVVGFPLLTSYALAEVPASHGAVVIAILPAATAVAATVRGRERPGGRFWVFTSLGVLAAVLFAMAGSGGVGALSWADLLLFGAVIAAGIGYAEGGLLARELGAWQTVSWALVFVFPLMLVLTFSAVLLNPPVASGAQWAAFGYLGAVSMFLGFFAWYRGLAIGPMTRVSQIQLIQPVLSIIWAALVLGETITPVSMIGGVAVIACAALAVRSRR